jgi:hypothetical protein
MLFPFPFRNPPSQFRPIFSSLLSHDHTQSRETEKANVFPFATKWNLPISMHHNVEDNLNELLAPPDAHGVICHDI